VPTLTLEGYELSFRAWCGAPRREKDLVLALALEDGVLRATLVAAGDAKLETGPMFRRATH
jgi:hypothetical protein